MKRKTPEAAKGKGLDARMERKTLKEKARKSWQHSIAYIQQKKNGRFFKKNGGSKTLRKLINQGLFKEP